MKNVIVAFILLASCCAASCLEPVGYSVPFNLESRLRAEAGVVQDVVAFPGSTFVKVHLKHLELGEGDTLLVSDGTEELATIKGPYSGERWLPSVSSGTAYLKIKGKNRGNSPYYLIDEVGVGTIDIGPVIESVCGIDDRKNALCYDAVKQNAGDAVGRMLFISSGIWYYCTGSLVSQNGHFLTNNHCIEDQEGASSLEIWWRYQTDTCESTQSTKEVDSEGSEFLTTDAGLDFTLLKLNNSSAPQKYGHLEIADRAPVKGETIWIPQHGGGGVKKFAVESDLDGGGPAKVIDNDLEGNIPGSDIGYYADTEGGSSGSPVLDAGDSILALHHFGLPSGYSCNYYMNQGVKMALIYPKIASYLEQPGQLEVSVTADPSQGPAPLATVITASVSGGTEPYSYVWDLGDGYTDTANPVHHTYDSAGSYTVSVTVTDSTGATGKVSTTVTAAQACSIIDIRKATEPFRLKVYGTNFQAGATVLIDGEEVPTSVVKSATLIVAKKGTPLKQMCPKGVEVTVTVVNRDGGTSNGWIFRR